MKNSKSSLPLEVAF